MAAELSESLGKCDAAWQAANSSTMSDLRRARLPSLQAVQDDPVRAEGARLQLQARREHDAWSRLPQITCPTLVMAGRHDGIAPVANSESIAAQISGSRLEVFEGGHAFLTQDLRSWEVLIDFLLDSKAEVPTG